MATSNDEWLQIYHDNLTKTSQPRFIHWSGHVTDATTVTATTAASGVSNQEYSGRITRPTNTSRRSRTSRRTPTTLLNTDITNFRAMVQQFTGCGGPTAIRAAPATVTATDHRPSTSYSTNSSGFNYYGMGSRISAPEQLPQQQYYTMTVENGGAGGNLHHGFVQRVQDGKVANFSGENNDGGKDNNWMF